MNTKKQYIGAIFLFVFLLCVMASTLVFLKNRNVMNSYREEWDMIMEIADNTVEEELQASEIKQSNYASELKIKLNELCSLYDVTVAVIDSGIDYEHFEKKKRIVDSYPNSLTDENGHGTMMAEIIAENSSEYVKIMPIKVTDKEGRATVEKVCRAIQYAIEQGADIINISMNTLYSSSSKLLEVIIDNAVEQGITVVVSAGNKSVDVKHIAPANIESATVISAADAYGRFADYSNFGETVDYCAIGEYEGNCGTSYAAAYYSGILAEVFAKGYSADYLSAYLIDKGESGKDIYYGNGIVALHEFKPMNLIQEMFGPEWGNRTESSILNMNDFHLVTNSKIDEFVIQSDLADVGYYLSNLSESDRAELLERDTILKQKVCFCESNLTENEVLNGNDIAVTKAKEYYYYEKCLEVYKKESQYLGISAQYYHKSGYFKLHFVDNTGGGKSATYEIWARVCLENANLDGSSTNNGKPTDRGIYVVGASPNSLTVWSRPVSGNSNTVGLNWQNVGGAYAHFYSDENSKPGRIFVPNIVVKCPEYTLMYTAPMSHANSGSNCAGRGNFFGYTK